MNNSNFTVYDIDWSSELTTTSNTVPTFKEEPEISNSETSFDIEGSLTDLGYVFVVCYDEDEKNS